MGLSQAVQSAVSLMSFCCSFPVPICFFQPMLVSVSMSLRHQIMYRIAVSALCMVLLGGALVIWQARQAVAKEVQASIQLVLQLVSFGIADTPAIEVDDLSRFHALRQTRHLTIALEKPDGQLIHFVGDQQLSHPAGLPPAWFIRMVQSEYPQVEHHVKTADGQMLRLLINAQPLDEITEVWEESSGFFVAVSLMTALTFLAVNLALNKSFKAIDIIVEGLRLVETGQYQPPLPRFSTTEFSQIANAINHMTSEQQKARLENRALTQHSLAIQEDERQRLSQELHDELGQSLTAIKVMAATLAQPAAKVDGIASTIMAICDHLMLVVRSMMQQLHPLMLSELGLKAALDDLISHWSERNPNLRLSIRCDDAVDTLDKAISIQVYRVIQESLTNVVRHAQAQQVAIEVGIRNDRQPLLQVQIKDDGQGCDLDATPSGFGLRGMQERIQSLGGALAMHSTPGHGMTISAHIPLNNDAP